MKPKLIRVTTVPISMDILLRNQLRFMSDYFEVIGVTGRDEKHFDEISRREGIRMVSIQMTRAVSPLKDLIALCKMSRLFCKERPFIVHSHTPKAGLIAMLAAWLARVPLRLHTLAGMPLMEAKGIKKLLLFLSERMTYACATHIYPNSEGLHRYVLEEKLGKTSKFKVIANGSSNGIDLNYFSVQSVDSASEIRNRIRAKYEITETDLVFCFVGRIVSDKGINELVRAFTELDAEAKLSGEKIRPILMLVGIQDATNLPTGQTQKILRAHSGVRLVGRHDDVRPFYIASDIFVFPSYREGFPNSVLQAGAMGLPCIVTNVNGCNEIISQGVNGLIIPPKNADKLHEAMRALFFQNSLRTRLASGARQSIASRFAQGLFFSELLKEYRMLVQQKRNIR